MTDTLSLYSVAEKNNIPVIQFNLPATESMSIQSGSGCYIGIDYKQMKDQASERVHLAHELGHCMTGAFYCRQAVADLRQRHENRADKWAIEHLISCDQLDQAVADGHTEIWDLAELFGVSEEFMKKAVCLYTYGNVAAEMYF